MAVYSHSKLSVFEQCPLKFRYKYIDKAVPDFEKTIEAHLGEIVHKTLEWIYSETKKGKTPAIDGIIKYYAEKWQDNYSDEMLIVKKELTEKDYFNKGVEFLVSYYNEHQPFRDGTIACEKRILIELGEEYRMIGFIDRLVYNLETGEYEIHDYKTADSMPSKEQADGDRQLALYSIAIKELFGEEKEIKLIWHYLAHNKRVYSKRTNEQLENLKKETLRLINEIESAEEFPANKSVLCNWCQFRKNCEGWKEE